MKKLIYNQKHIPKNKWRYGLRSSAATGCGWIATHNALRLMGYLSNPTELIQYYEHHFPLINGNFGTFIFSIIHYFKQHQFQTKLIYQRKKFDDASKNCDACILFYFWRNKYNVGLHYITVQYSYDNYWGYNTYSNSTKADNLGSSLEEFLRQRHYFGSLLITIQDKRTSK